jgi:hypothetical protein
VDERPASHAGSIAAGAGGGGRPLIDVSPRVRTVAVSDEGGKKMQRRLALWLVACAAALVAAATPALSGTGAPTGTRFVSAIDNRYLPLRPGTVLRYRGTEDGEAASSTFEVTRRTKVIAGVRTTVVRDTFLVGGAAAEKTDDYFAQDERGNVWYFGEDSYDRVSGRWVRSDGSWLAGVDGAKAGIVMKARPRVGDTYRQEWYRGHAEDMARVLKTGVAVTVPYGRFDGALQTREWTPLEPGVVEHKWYAPGIGEVRSLTTEGGSDEMRLVSVRKG